MPTLTNYYAVERIIIVVNGQTIEPSGHTVYDMLSPNIKDNIETKYVCCYPSALFME